MSIECICKHSIFYQKWLNRLNIQPNLLYAEKINLNNLHNYLKMKQLYSNHNMLN